MVDDCGNVADATEKCFMGHIKMKWDKVKSSTTSNTCGKISWQNYLWLRAKHEMPLCPLKHVTVSLQMKFDITLFSTQISIFLLSTLTPAMKEMPNSGVELR
jgi:hypothetical protein